MSEHLVKAWSSLLVLVILLGPSALVLWLLLIVGVGYGPALAVAFLVLIGWGFSLERVRALHAAVNALVERLVPRGRRRL